MSARDERNTRASFDSLPSAYDEELDGLDEEEETKVQLAMTSEAVARRLAMKQELHEVAKMAEAMRERSSVVPPPPPPAGPVVPGSPSAPPPPSARSGMIRATRPAAAQPFASAVGDGRPSGAARAQAVHARMHPAVTTPTVRAGAPVRTSRYRGNWLLISGALVVAVPGGILLGQLLSSSPAPSHPTTTTGTARAAPGQGQSADSPRSATPKASSGPDRSSGPPSTLPAASAEELARPAAAASSEGAPPPSGAVPQGTEGTGAQQSPPTAASLSDPAGTSDPLRPARHHPKASPPREPAEEISPTSN